MPLKIPPTMRALVWRGDPDPSFMKVEVLRTPKPRKGEVLIKTISTGVCHTDLHCIKGEVPFPHPAVFGHEVSGEVVEICDGDLGSVPNPALQVGSRVVSTFIMPCGQCDFCKIGEEDTCSTFFAMNRLRGHLYDDTTRLFVADTGEEVAMYSMAGLAEYCCAPRSSVFPLPEKIVERDLTSESCVLGCAFFTAFGAIQNAAGNIRKNTSVCVIGCGGVGGALMQLLRYLGAFPIVAIDVSDKALESLKTAGLADFTINSNAGQEQPDYVTQKILEITNGRKVDVCFEVIGMKKTFEQAVMSVRDGGKACYIGIADVKAKAEVPITHVVRRRISLVGSYGARASKDMPPLLEIAADGGINLSKLISKKLTLEEAAKGYSDLNERKIIGRAIVTFQSPSSL